jgi:hypothetical protein
VFGTDSWTLEQRLHTGNVLKIKDGQVFDFERLEVQDRDANHRITPKLSAHASPWKPQK